MAKIIKRELSRGVKLTAEQAFDPIVNIEAQIEGKTVEKENIKSDESVFRINYTMPQINSNAFFAQKVKRDGFDHKFVDEPWISCVAFPFTLPPPQEQIIMNGVVHATDKTSENTTRYVLDELSFSFDQRSEGMGIQDRFSTLPVVAAAGGEPGWDQGGSPGAAGFNDRKLVLDGADNYDIKITIVEKGQTWFEYPNGTVPGDWEVVADDMLKPQSEILSIEVPAIAFKSKNLRLNPFAVDQLNKQLNPWKTYVCIISVPNLCGGDYEDFEPTGDPPVATYAIPELFGLMSFNLSLKLRCKLLEKDVAPDPIPVGENPIQNIPTNHYGRTTAPALNVVPPAGGVPIDASTNTGLQKNINVIDTAIKNKLDGGYTKESDLQGARALKDVAGYEVITVPMWQNFTDFGVMDPSTIELGTFPDATLGAGEDVGAVGYADRRIIPINYPMTIHQVILAVSYINPYGVRSDLRQDMLTSGIHPTSATLVNRIGVGIGTGHRGADTTYSQVAYVNYTPDTRPQFTIDRIRLSDQSGMVDGNAGGLNRSWELELLNCPLSGNYAQATGYTGNLGTPIFVGKAVGGMTGVTALGTGTTHGTINRSDIVLGTPPPTAGREQWIEVRWNISDINGLNYDGGATGPSTWYNTYVGIGGCWVYIIGKKHLTHWKDDLNLP